MQTHLTKVWPLIFLICALITSARAQFSTVLLQNDGYWADGKAEFNIYAAEIMRDGAPRSCEVLHILTREKLENVPMLKLNQILTVPMGLLWQQQMHSSFWRVDNGQLGRLSLTSSDSVSSAYKEAHREGDYFSYQSRSAMDETGNISLPENTRSTRSCPG